MLARRTLPDHYARWNSREHAPFGRPGHGKVAAWAPRNALSIRYVTPYGWQPNSTTRRFEYPWAFEAITKLGQGLVVADVGAGLAGMQWSLARAGYHVHAVDPGLNAKGRGWELDPDFHQLLSKAYRAPVTLHPTTLREAELANDSVDVVLSVSTIEHFTDVDITEFAEEARRVLRPGGHFVLTVDLFLDLEPFTSRVSNRYGTNFNVRELLDALNAELVLGHREELYGFPAFDKDSVQSRLADFQVGEGYPGLAQCLVAAAR